MENTIKYATFGQRLRATVVKGWQRGAEWTATLGDLAGAGPSQAAAMDNLAEQVRQVCDNAYDKGYLVQHEDGSLTICQWVGETVSQSRVREGRLSCVSSGPWQAPKEAAEAAVQPEAYGPGVIVRL